ncbi:MAG TPA: DNA recombination protein RmuC [Candidatus Paceibacterota bacterium]|mgnify:FL=1|nr:DNA recombination protein RmuC [Candidatus ainarchaeum sp.]HOO47799.1 DNA recombination protein RmuC [Candidatus Paceibacterota bacterium]HPI81988.1 DNA recombination protein RmuC [Candidatus Paceibacterota bacterium]HPK14302.1 DNA recombination protein RmuC [Candidatus Paceibacterota bacterium]HPR84009.1 DNA recombination protein RmuC [Candidatus Paceibacterota bacterium]
MQTIIIISIIVLFVLIALMLFILLRRKQPEKKDDNSLQLLLNQINEISRTLDNKLGESQKEISQSMRYQATETSRIIADITEKITRLDETNKQVVSFADQLKNLQDILKNPKQRGVLGEYYLETLLKNVMPPGSYQMQYSFSNGNIVDAVVFVKDKIIPIDSKFSLENYNRITETNDRAEKERLEKIFVNDLKNRIEETSKYIDPSQNTMDFAFMFIPHEAIYYDLLINKIGAVTEETENLVQRAASKYKVIIVSPTSFLAYLQTVLQGLKAMQIEESAKDIVKRVGELGTHLRVYEELHQKLGNALSTVVNHFNKSNNEFRKIDKDVMRITGETIGIENLTLEKPQNEE